MTESKHTEVILSNPQLDVYTARTPLILDMAGQGSGKTELIGIQTIEVILKAPKVKGFIAANTYIQLSQSTLTKVFSAWERCKGWREYTRENKSGCYVTDKKPPAHFKKYHYLKNYHNTISFDNGCLIFTGSLDNYKAHEGKEVGWAHLDETKDTPEIALKTVLLARIRQRGLYYARNNELMYSIGTQDEVDKYGLTPFNPCYIHTSPSEGGVDWIIKMFNLDGGDRPKLIKETLLDKDDYYLQLFKNTTAVIYSTFHNAKNLPEGWIENKILTMTDDEIMLFIYGYPFARAGNEYYPEFKMMKHVVSRIKPDFNALLYVGYDFNVVPYVTQVVMQIDTIIRYYNAETKEKVDFLEAGMVGFKAVNVMRFKVIKEFLMRPPDNESEKGAEVIGQWYTSNGGNQGIQVYGDAEGHSRIRGLGSLKQYSIIKRIFDKYISTEIKAKRANISVLARKKLMNRIFAGVYPELEIYIAAECVETVKDLEFLKQAPQGGKHKEREKDKVTGDSYEKIGHCSDALEYIICEILRGYLKNID